MTKKTWTLIALAVVLGAFSLYFNRDWFAGENIQIMSRSMPRRGGFVPRRQANAPAVMPIVFGLNRKFSLTDVKVVALSDIQTNKYPHALWHMITESNSIPLRQFFYGAAIKGMRPEYKNIAAESLEPGKKYRLFVESGPLKGQHDFEAVAATP